MSSALPDTTPAGRAPVEFAYWVPNVSGGLVVSNLPQRTSHEPAYNIETARAAEAAGFTYALSQVRYAASYGADAQHESTSFSLALLLATEKLKVIAAVHPYFWPPVVLAKWAATAQALTGDRLCLNVVSGWFKKEALDLGAQWLEHDERYEQSEEFIEVLRGAWTTDHFAFEGKHFQVGDVNFRPQPDVLPEVFQGGNSTAARQMAGRVSDWYFMNGNTPEGVAEQVAQVGGYAAENGRTIRFGLNAFAVVRDTEAEAVEVLDAIIANADADKVNDFGSAVKEAGASAKDGKGMWADSEFKDLVQYNDGFRTGLIGTPEQVARRVLAYRLIGVDLVLLGFLHVKEEVEAFGRTVIPRVRELEAELAALPEGTDPVEHLGLTEELAAAREVLARPGAVVPV
ncbi:dimethylsulfone monooxygenase SfnG [Quadrisphaera sp. INWT6]|uniref:dimethylsulfone monooxygenase SfnG n=1 Tax=Quadrisphaera sp. INWT6 TaxID=2596917 RepID=UPI0018924EE0|nr:dimethyl sulfone monooxygenase SfnG [Quadrisphaera sp. INWT6]MBF5081612.1 dimethyl sulfone monooxygenase SfnG [Quadrisphaera sp. INWT6]